VSHYETVASETAQGKSEQKRVELDEKLFWRRFANWCYTLVFALMPSALVFFAYTGPPRKFDFLVFFSDNALFYVGITMSAVALCTYRLKDELRFWHIIILLIGMSAYFPLAMKTPIVLFMSNEKIKGWTVFVFLVISIVVGILTLYASAKKIKRGK
jgi:hypothetical protein